MRLIDADALKEFINNYYNKTSSIKSILIYIDNAPTVEPEKITCFGMRSGKQELLLNALRPKGEWNEIQAGMFCCPFCGARPHKDFKNFCAKCGADMRGNQK